MTDAAIPRIDAHHHLWDLDVRDQPWTVDLPVLRRSFTMTELAPQLDAAAMDGTVLVETINVAEETPEFLALAAENPWILGVVGWVDLTAPDVADRVAELRALPGGECLVGIRHQVQGEPDPEWLRRPDVVRGLSAVRDAGLVFELLVTAVQLPAAVAVTGRVPGLRWVLDHAGKPPIAATDPELFDVWAGQIDSLARHEDVACKLSGLVTEAGSDWTPEALAPYADHVLGSFGPDRVMAGSDWPVCLLRASYDEVDSLTDVLLTDLAEAERQQVRGGTAARWYDLRI